MYTPKIIGHAKSLKQEVETILYYIAIYPKSAMVYKAALKNLTGLPYEHFRNEKIVCLTPYRIKKLR